MAGTNLGFPYDAEIFNYSWKNTPDLILTTMIESGAVVNNPEIARLISNGSNFFTTPYYDVLAGTEDVYNGVNNFTGGTLTGGTYSGCVYGRMAKWTAKSFIKDFNSGADPMAQIVSGVANFWIKARQVRLLGILNALFGITGDADFATHIKDIASVGSAQAETMTVTAGATTPSACAVKVTATGLTGSPLSVAFTPAAGDDTAEEVATAMRTALTNNAAVSAKFTVGGTGANVTLTKKVIADFDSTLKIEFVDNATPTGITVSASTDTTTAVTIGDSNLIGVTTINDTCVQANGDNAGNYYLVICHSNVANRLANLQLLEYSKYTDSAGITRNLPIGTINGKTLIVNDNVPVNASPVEGASEYTTYILGLGAIGYASAPVDIPSEMDRDANTNGGVDMIYTRLRECIAPNGFSFKGDVTTDVGIPDSVLLASASWERKMPAKSIFMAKLVTNG